MILPKKRTGFTLIELLVVLGILAILFAIVLVAVNPPRQFAQARDTQRQSDVNAMLNAIHQSYIESKPSKLPGTPIIDTTPREICKGTACTSTDTTDLCALAPTYIADLPSDPSTGTKNPCTPTPKANYTTGYTVVSTGATGANRITVSATSEITPATPISVTR